MEMQKHWYLGFLGFVGFFEIGAFLNYIHGDGHWLALTGPLWFLWFLDFIPQARTNTEVPDDK